MHCDSGSHGEACRVWNGVSKKGVEGHTGLGLGHPSLRGPEEPENTVGAWLGHGEGAVQCSRLCCLVSRLGPEIQGWEPWTHRRLYSSNLTTDGARKVGEGGEGGWRRPSCTPPPQAGARPPPWPGLRKGQPCPLCSSCPELAFGLNLQPTGPES